MYSGKTYLTENKSDNDRSKREVPTFQRFFAPRSGIKFTAPWMIVARLSIYVVIILQLKGMVLYGFTFYHRPYIGWTIPTIRSKYSLNNFHSSIRRSNALNLYFRSKSIRRLGHLHDVDNDTFINYDDRHKVSGENVEIQTSNNNSSNFKPDDNENNEEEKKMDLCLVLVDNYDSYTYNLYSYLSIICNIPPLVIANDSFSSWEEFMKEMNLTASPQHETNKRKLDGIILGPGPGTPNRPEDVGLMNDAIASNPDLPILGVCLGHQAIGRFYGANVTLAPSGPVHGLLSNVWRDNVHETKNSNFSEYEYLHEGEEVDHEMEKQDNSSKFDLFTGIPLLFPVVRYHSLVVQLPVQGSHEGNGIPIRSIAWCRGDPLLENGERDRRGFTDMDVKNNDKVCMALCHNKYPHFGVQFHPESVGTGENGFRLLENFCKICHIHKKKSHNISQSHHGAILGKDTIIEKTASKSLKRTETRTKSKYKVLIHKMPKSSLPSKTPEQVFENFYSSSSTSFWLDSSTGQKDADKKEIEQNLERYISRNNSFEGNSANTKYNSVHGRDYEKSSQETDKTNSCPIVSNSRFSIMGGSDGPLFKYIEYFGKEHSSDSRGLYIIDKLASTPDIKRRKVGGGKDILTYLREELTNHGEIDFVSIVDDIKHNGTYTPLRCVNESSSELPFTFRGGYVGFLGYEIRHDTRRFLTGNAKNLSAEKDDKDDTIVHELQMNTQVPTAAFMFADRSLVYDHWRDDWYLVAAITNLHNIRESEDMIRSDTSVQVALSWMKETCKKMHHMAQATYQDDKASLDQVDNAKGPGSDQHLSHVGTKNHFSKDSINFEMNRSKEQYKADISRCHDEIRKGESYELCLTNQLKTHIYFPSSVHKAKSSPWALYKKLRKKNPAPFAAFINFSRCHEYSRKDGNSLNVQKSSDGQFFICCSSPERFLSTTRKFGLSNNVNDTISCEYVVESKPIKGTAARIVKSEKDIDNNSNTLSMRKDFMVAEELRSSTKNRAENLMIVDLLRNDLSRICKPGSVHVPKLMHVETFATVHQLVSTVRGTFEQGTANSIDLISACFPGGSMTGAPKLRTVDILNEIEKGESRGPYSGCLGYFSLNGCLDMNIVIRTAIVTPDLLSGNSLVQNNSSQDRDSSDCMYEEYQPVQWRIDIGTGGAITALSESDDEFEETMLKAKAVIESVTDWYNEGVQNTDSLK